MNMIEETIFYSKEVKIWVDYQIPLSEIVIHNIMKDNKDLMCVKTAEDSGFNVYEYETESYENEKEDTGNFHCDEYQFENFDKKTLLLQLLQDKEVLSDLDIQNKILEQLNKG